MKKLIFYAVLIFALTGCSKHQKENETDQLQTDIMNDSNSDRAITITEAPASTPTISPAIRRNINLEDNELLSNLKELCSSPRKFGTEGEERALKFLAGKMAEYGYQTYTQDFSVYHIGTDWITPSTAQDYFNKYREETKKFGTGQNIIATTANPEGKRTLYITAHYDTTHDTKGIIDNGSGVAVAMEIARQLQGIILPINIEYVFLARKKPDYRALLILYLN